MSWRQEHNTLTVSVVIPTIGRPELRQAIESALSQTVRVLEVIVCLDADREIDAFLPSDSRVRVLRTGPGRGGNAARQAGIEAAAGDLIALLDDDDTWVAQKIQVQLADIQSRVPRSDAWIATSRLTTVSGNSAGEIWPEQLMRVGERLGPYIFRKHRPRGGQGFVQASTLLFPRSLGIRHPFDANLAFHQDIDWLNSLDHAEPSLVVIQSGAALTRYAVGAASVSKAIDPVLSLEWAQRNIVDDPRSLGDFILTTVVIYASRRGRPFEVIRMVAAGCKLGRPGWPAFVFAGYRLLVALRVMLARRAGTRRRLFRSFNPIKE